MSGCWLHLNFSFYASPFHSEKIEESVSTFGTKNHTETLVVSNFTVAGYYQWHNVYSSLTF